MSDRVVSLITIFQPAGNGCRFEPDAFSASLGKSIPFDMFGIRTTATLIGAKVDHDGSGVHLTFDIPVSNDAEPNDRVAPWVPKGMEGARFKGAE